MDDNINLCYNSAIPGLIDSDSGSDDTSIVNRKKYSDPDGSINIQIAGPFPADSSSIENVIYRVYIDKDTSREKFTVFTKDSVVDKTYSNDVDISSAIIYAELDTENPEYEYHYLRIKSKDLLLARGTYFIHVYTSPYDSYDFDNSCSCNWKKIKEFTLTVKSDPIQGPDVNRRYIETAISGIYRRFPFFEQCSQAGDLSNNDFYKTELQDINTYTLLFLNDSEKSMKIIDNALNRFVFKIYALTESGNVKVKLFSVTILRKNNIISSSNAEIVILDSFGPDISFDIDLRCKVNSDKTLSVEAKTNQACTIYLYHKTQVSQL